MAELKAAASAAARNRKSFHRCTSCGDSFPQWSGRCSGCGEWNTIVEEQASIHPLHERRAGTISSLDLENVGLDPTGSGISELDRVLGGGLLAGSVTLLGGEPGIGKSTLVLQLCASMASGGSRCLMVTGEESVEQVGRRARRLGGDYSGLLVLAETDVETVLASVNEAKPDLVIVDSIQTMSATGVSGGAGSVSQVRECAQAFTSMAKLKGVAVVMVGHVTKDGSLAGPRVLEHVVDTVLEFEGDRHHNLRFVRAAKHRFGPTDEVGVFEMKGDGLRSVSDPSGVFLDDRRPGTAGSIVVPTMQGRRPLLVELQALVTKSQLPHPRRVAQGLDTARFTVALAILDERAGIKVGTSDVYASVVGGVKIDEPGADLALGLAVASSFVHVPLPDDLVAVGEIGLGGEVRKVSHLDKRLNEAARMGFRCAMVPEGTPDGPMGLMQVRVATLGEAVAKLKSSKGVSMAAA